MELIITILPVVTKDLPISPRFTPYNFSSRCKFSTLTTRQPMVEFNLLTFPRSSSLPSCLWSLRIFPSLPDSRLTNFYRDVSLALLQLVNQWLNFTYSRSHAFRYERKNTNPTLVRIELTTSALAGVQVTYKTTRATRLHTVIIIRRNAAIRFDLIHVQYPPFCLVRGSWKS